ncbi:MAG: hypothetical protein RAP03_05460 [Candidatus Electryonea clarkiae]|nr:hypothetical protein [Candidatus Electryonea clarkiae]
MKKMMLTALCLVFLSAGTLAFAEDVHVTQNGAKYHKKTCRFVKNRETKVIDKNEAVAENYKPCGRCYKEDLAISDKNEGKKVALKQEDQKVKK